MPGSRSCIRLRVSVAPKRPRLFHHLQGIGLLLLVALSWSCGPRNFAVGEGRDCEQGTLNCVCDSAKACQAPLICRADLCISADGSEPDTSTGTRTASDASNPTLPNSSDSEPTTTGTTAQCQSDNDCTPLSEPCQRNSCQQGVCVQVAAPDQNPCTDNERCIPKGSCEQGLCQGTAARFMAEDFSKGAGKWAMTSPTDQATQWEIGPAKASECDEAGRGEDPEQDHSPSSDNMLAGTRIGGCSKERTIRKWDCLMSPKMDISSFQGKLEFSYWRHLHTPPTIVQGLKAAHYRVFAVFNGKTPVIVEEGYDAAVNDQAWQRSTHLLDANDTSLTVSFCFETGYGAKDFAGWSVDDIRVRAQGCDAGL